jgi:hypothetical protein
MRFVDVFVEDRMMKRSVHPVEAILSEEQETKRVKMVSMWHPVKVGIQTVERRQTNRNSHMYRNHHTALSSP